MVEIDRVKILVLVETQAVEHIAREDHQSRTARAEGDRLAGELADRAGRIVAAEREHSRRRIHRGDDLERGARAADAHQRFIGRLSRHQGDVEAARFEQPNVLHAALGIARLDRERAVGRVDDVGDRAAVKREAAARRRRPEHDLGFLHVCSCSLRRRAGCEQHCPRAYVNEVNKHDCVV